MATQNTKHQQHVVDTTHYREQGLDFPETIEVDIMMYQLLKEMWNLGIATNFSCQGDTHLFVNQDCYEAQRYRAYIQMPRNASSLGFIRELFAEGRFSSMMISWDVEFSTNPQTLEPRITIRFPSCDIGPLLHEILSWN